MTNITKEQAIEKLNVNIKSEREQLLWLAQQLKKIATYIEEQTQTSQERYLNSLGEIQALGASVDNSIGKAVMLHQSLDLLERIV